MNFLQKHTNRFRSVDHRTWPDVADDIVADMPERVLVDVYDTILLRRVVGNDNIRTVIHDAIASSSRGDADQQAIETTVEGKLAVVAPGAAEALARIRAAGASVCLVSDTPLGSTFLRELLTSLEVLEEGDSLVVPIDSIESADQLFAAAIGDTALDRIAHVGNYELADAARAKGVRTLPLPSFAPNRFENIYAATGVAGGIVAAASRHARLSIVHDLSRTGDAADRVFADIGASVAGLAFVPFVLWTRDACRERGITHVAFSARDGHLPMDIAAALPTGYWDECQPVYMHGNRKTLSVAGAAALGIETWLELGTLDDDSFLLHRLYEQPVAQIVSRIGLQLEELPSDLALSTMGPDECLALGQEKLWHDVLADERVRQLVQNKAEEQLDVIADYLHELGINDGPSAIVDVGWTGRMSAIVSAIVSARSGHVPLTLHFGAKGVTPEVDRLLDVRRFAFDDVDRVAPVHNIVSCVEAFTTTGLERAKAFQRDAAGRVTPELTEPIVAIAGPDRDKLHDAACLVARSLPPHDHLLAPYLVNIDQLAEASAQIMTELWLRPTVNEARAIGRLKFELDEKLLILSPAASAFTVRTIVDDSLVVRRQWRNGSIQLTPEPLRSVLKLMQRASKTLRPSKPLVG